MLQLKEISKTYKRKNLDTTEVLRNISLDIQDGECVAIIGPSGSGKTTLLRAVAGLDEFSSGQVVLNGEKLTSASHEQGMVFQHFSLFPWLTVKENIAFGLRLKKLSTNDIERIVERYLVITGLTQFKDAYPRALSGGMKQRVAIARTLANDPSVFLLDEPFAALDVQTRAQMQDFLARIIEGEKKTTLLVTHDVEEALYLADRIVVLSTKPATIKEIVTIPFPRPRRRR